MLKINLPLTVWIPRKVGEDKLIYLNQNWYRNAHHMTLNKVKELFKEIVSQEFGEDSPKLGKGKFSFHYRLFPGSNRAVDVMNPGSVIDKFAADALVELGVIPDDNHKILPEFRFSFGGIDKENPRCELEISAIA
jgi:hypothetical protein